VSYVLYWEVGPLRYGYCGSFSEEPERIPDSDLQILQLPELVLEGLLNGLPALSIFRNIPGWSKAWRNQATDDVHKPRWNKVPRSLKKFQFYQPEDLTIAKSMAALEDIGHKFDQNYQILLIYFTYIYWAPTIYKWYVRSLGCKAGDGCYTQSW
jgi:hypothetical protein